MARRTGSADLPLHGGRVPPWLATRMSSLGAVITQAIVHHYGRDEFLQRLSHPFWFQSFGAVMGMDCHSFAVGTRVTSRPPHRSVRAQFGHTAPTSGVERRSESLATDEGFAVSGASRR